MSCLRSRLECHHGSNSCCSNPQFGPINAIFFAGKFFQPQLYKIEVIRARGFDKLPNDRLT